MKRLFAFLFLFLISSTAFSASFDPKLDWKTITTDHFHVHFGAPLAHQAGLVSKYLEEAYEKLTPEMNWKPRGRTEVIVTDNFDSANGMSSTLPYNWMIIRVASPEPDSVLADYDNWLRTLCFHEYTHIVHIDQVGGIMWFPRIFLGKVVSPNGTVPGWMREGVSTYVETAETTKGRGNASYSDMMLRTATLDDKFPKIDEADGLGWRWPGYQSMYIYGVEFVQYLADTYGEEKVMEFHNHVAKSPLLYAVNHHARHVFSNIEFEPKKVHNRYDRVRKEGTERSKTFYDMWREWQEVLKKRYAGVKAKVEAEGVTKFEDVAAGGTVLSSPAASPDGKYLAYARARVKGPAEIHLLDLSTGVNKVIKKRQLATRISFSPDSKKIVYSAAGAFKTYNSYNDLYQYDIETKKVTRLTTGLRAYDPSYSPDGKKIIYVIQDKGTGSLHLYDVEKKTSEELKLEVSEIDNGSFTQFATPMISPDGRTLAVNSWQVSSVEPYPIGAWDIYLYDIKTGKRLKKLTSDGAVDTAPVWDRSGDNIYISSDRTGISNIYKIKVKGQGAGNRADAVRVTNVLTGAFQPAISPDGSTLYVQYYNGEGYDIRKTELRPAGGKVFVQGETKLQAGSGSRAAGHGRFSLLPPAKTLAVREAERTDEQPAEKYSPFGKPLFLPRFVIPNFAIVGDGVMFAAMTGGADPLRRHNWLGGATYRTDLTNYVGYFFNYFYNRYKPILAAGIMGYAVNFGDITFLHSDGSRNTVHLFEQRRRLYGGISYPWGKQAFGLQYFWEYREPKTSLTPEEKNALNFGNFAGFTVNYTYGTWEKYLASISNEHGRKMRLNFTITDKSLGSSSKNEQYIFAGDYREYINMPWANHVLALKVGGGMVWGDEMPQGTFSMGGALGEGNMGGGDSPYYFPLRGLPIASLSRTRAMLFSGEYRIPLWSPQRGLGTSPFYLQNLHFAPFADYGNAWNANQNTGDYFFDYFFLGTGAELRADFYLGHGLPVTGRLGYGIIVVNRDRLGNTKDPILNTPVKNGVLVLQLGTSF